MKYKPNTVPEKCFLKQTLGLLGSNFWFALPSHLFSSWIFFWGIFDACRGIRYTTLYVYHWLSISLFCVPFVVYTTSSVYHLPYIYHMFCIPFVVFTTGCVYHFLYEETTGSVYHLLYIPQVLYTNGSTVKNGYSEKAYNDLTLTAKKFSFLVTL